MEAITREEKIISGENLTPITRKEMFLAKAAGQSVETPEPVTREEMFLSNISGGSGGATINNQDKTITENGVYQADEGYTGLGTVTVEVASTGGGDIDALIDGSIAELTSEATSVRQYIFYNDTNIVTANFPSATSIGDYTFYRCTSLKTIDFPLVTNIGNGAFQYCERVKTASFPLLTSINNSVFYYCTTLNTANFSLVTSIGSNAFFNCQALSSLIIRSETICALSNKNAFNYSPVASGTGYIYVPRALVDSYKTSTNWSDFATQFRALEDYTVDGTINGELDESKI